MSKKIIYPLLAFLILLTIWEISTLIFSEQLLVLPSPTAIFRRIFERWDRFLFHTKVTVSEMMGGFFFAFLAAFPLAWMMYSWNTARLVLQPIFVFIQCIPMFALAPIMVIWFGWSYTAIVVPTALMVFFPLTISIYQGLRSTPEAYLDYFRINQATPWQIFYKLQLPWSVPHVFSGFRIAAAIAGIGAVAGEWSGAQNGLGILMLESRRATDLETTFGALFCLAFVSCLFYSLILIFENRLLRYHGMSAKILSLFFSLFLLSACQKENSSNETRMLLDWLPNPNHVVLYVGIEKGFFAENGINLTIQKIPDPSDAIPYVTSGRAELAVYYMPDAIRAMERGSNLQPIGILFKQPLNCIMFRSHEGIQKASDLSQKNIGYCVDGTSTTVLDYILERNDISPNEKRNVSFDLVSTLGTKQVDAIYGAYWNIESEHLRSLGIQTDHFELIDLQFPDYYELIVVARGNSPQTTPKFVEGFKKALQDSIRYSVKHPQEAFEIYMKANPDKSSSTLAWERSAWNETFPLLTRDQHFDMWTWETLRQWIVEHQLQNQG